MVNSPGLIVHINALLPSLSPAEQRVARLVVADPADAAGHTITHLATAASTSEATVIRFCRSVGIAGYPQLRIRLAAEAAEAATRGRPTDDRVAGGEIPPDADLARIVATIAFNEARAVEETAAQLDLAACERVVDAVDAAGRIEVYGTGSSGCAALDLQQKLHRIGRSVAYWPDPQAALASTSLLAPGDVAIGISHSGASAGVLDVLAQARLRGAVTVALTNFPRSPLAEAADLVLTTAARETTYRSGALAGRLAQLMVIDCLFVGVAVRNRKRSGQALAAADEATATLRAPGGRGKGR
ncbi:MurR/RpiR family transcriptional regulator [Catenuloplanes japonicus]|uniref:MurR/RpiR family transcriptional regulator n=1 Tax=Catenuloplanes japonicus TaxID=33876 RepID=UPI0005250649|nr:MurR/RpiR family transcriptional regulator [Catenuloplanes japonicus]